MVPVLYQWGVTLGLTSHHEGLVCAEKTCKSLVYFCLCMKCPGGMQNREKQVLSVGGVAGRHDTFMSQEGT